MRAILRFVIDKPLATFLAIVLIALTGIYSVYHMPVDLFPNLEVPVVNIITHYAVASPEDTEFLISRPIEDEMRTIPGVKRVSLISSQGISQVTVEFNWGTAVKDASQAVQGKLAEVGGMLPEGVSPRLENIGTTLQEVVGFVVYGGSDLITLKNIVQHDVASRLMGVEGVSAVEVFGGEQRAFIIKIKPEALTRVCLSVDDIITTLKNHNITAASGYMDRSSREYLIHGEALLKTLDDIRSIPIMANNEDPWPRPQSGSHQPALARYASSGPGGGPEHHECQRGIPPEFYCLLE